MICVDGIQIHKRIGQTSDLPVQFAPCGEKLGIANGTVSVDQTVSEPLTLGVGITGAYNIEP